jgi:hypothetical protein
MTSPTSTGLDRPEWRACSPRRRPARPRRYPTSSRVIRRRSGSSATWTVSSSRCGTRFRRYLRQAIARSPGRPAAGPLARRAEPGVRLPKAAAGVGRLGRHRRGRPGAGAGELGRAGRRGLAYPELRPNELVSPDGAGDFVNPIRAGVDRLLTNLVDPTSAGSTSMRPLPRVATLRTTAYRNRSARPCCVRPSGTKRLPGSAASRAGGDAARHRTAFGVRDRGQPGERFSCELGAALGGASRGTPGLRDRQAPRRHRTARASPPCARPTTTRRRG